MVCSLPIRLYKAASVFFSQIPHPPQVYIGFDGNAANVDTDLIAIDE